MDKETFEAIGRITAVLLDVHGGVSKKEFARALRANLAEDPPEQEILASLLLRFATVFENADEPPKLEVIKGGRSAKAQGDE